MRGHAGGPARSSDEAPVMGVERRGRVVRGMLFRSTRPRRWSGRSRRNMLKSSSKPFDISKREVWDAWTKVKGNQGAPGADGVSIEEFEADLENHLYKIQRSGHRGPGGSSG